MKLSILPIALLAALAPLHCINASEEAEGAKIEPQRVVPPPSLRRSAPPRYFPPGTTAGKLSRPIEAFKTMAWDGTTDMYVGQPQAPCKHILTVRYDGIVWNFGMMTKSSDGRGEGGWPNLWSLPEEEFKKLQAAFTKFLQWEQQAKQQKPVAFSKFIGETNYEFQWDGQNAVFRGIPEQVPQDKVMELFKNADTIRKEWKEKTEAAEKAADAFQ